MERIKLNLIPSGVAPVVHVSQYDEGREFACDLFEGANVYTLDGTETLTVQVRKPDGHLVTESVTNTSDSYIVVTTTEQMCAVHGTNLANLKIEKGSIEIASLNFLMEVERDPLENGDPSESFVDNLNTQIYNAVANQYDSNNVIFDNAPTSGHNQPYTVTSDGIKSTIDNLELDDLHDVTISGAVSGEALTWDGTKWVNGTVSTVGSIDDLNDVDTTGKVDNSSLVYNSNDSEWQAKKLTVTLTQAEYDQLKLDGDLVEGTNYIITDGQNVTCDLGDLDDVSISSASNGDVFAYNNGAWVNKSVKPTPLTISGTPAGITNNSKAYKLTDNLVLIDVEVTFSTASGSYEKIFDIAWSGATPQGAFGVVTNQNSTTTYAQAYWNVNQITVRIDSPQALRYRGQVIVICL